MIKTFEEFEKFEKKHKLKKGDYVICHTIFNTSFLSKNEINQFLDTNVGRYVKYNKAYEFKYGIKYDNVPHNLQSAFNDEGLYWANKNEIFDWSNSKEELEVKISVRKYNI